MATSYPPQDVEDPLGVGVGGVGDGVDGSRAHFVRSLRDHHGVHHHVEFHVWLPVVPGHLEIIRKSQAKS